MLNSRSKIMCYNARKWRGSGGSRIDRKIKCKISSINYVGQGFHDTTKYTVRNETNIFSFLHLACSITLDFVKYKKKEEECRRFHPAVSDIDKSEDSLAVISKGHNAMNQQGRRGRTSLRDAKFECMLIPRLLGTAVLLLSTMSSVSSLPISESTLMLERMQQCRCCGPTAPESTSPL